MEALGGKKARVVAWHHLADKLQRIQVVVFAVKAQLDLSVRALAQGLYHYILIDKGTPLKQHSTHIRGRVAQCN